MTPLPSYEYREPKPLLRGEAERLLSSSDLVESCLALVSLTFHDPDWRWVQEQCLRMAQSVHPEHRGVAATCLGHIARIHGALDLATALPVLESLRNDPELHGQATDALDEIRMHLGTP